MKITTVNISEIAKHPTQRMDAEYWISKKENELQEETLKDFHNHLATTYIFYYLRLKQCDYVINIPDSLFVLYREEAFSSLEFRRMKYFFNQPPYFFNQPPYSTLFSSYKVLGNSIVFNIKKK
jgi:hypothetical protein